MPSPLDEVPALSPRSRLQSTILPTTDTELCIDSASSICIKYEYHSPGQKPTPYPTPHYWTQRNHARIRVSSYSDFIFIKASLLEFVVAAQRRCAAELLALLAFRVSCAPILPWCSTI